MQNAQTIAGLHLSGPNAHRTAVVVLTGHPLIKPLELIGLYEKIGSHGKLFSDERIVDVLIHEAPLHGVYVDCPLSVPPCVACQRPTCPGVVACEDLSVAYMQALSTRLKRQGARKKRPINPQSQRLWDVAFQAETDRGFEPTYSANMAPLVTRAMTLQRRLFAAVPGLKLRETSVFHTLVRFCRELGIADDAPYEYRSFERGKLIRTEIIKRMLAQHWIGNSSPEEWEPMWHSVDVFHGFVTALAGSFVQAGLTQRRPIDFLPEEGWVYLPEFCDSWPAGEPLIQNM